MRKPASKNSPLLSGSFYSREQKWDRGETLTLNELTAAVAHYAKGNSAFARDIVKADPRELRRWLSGKRMRSGRAQRVNEYRRAHGLADELRVS